MTTPPREPDNRPPHRPVLRLVHTGDAFPRPLSHPLSAQRLPGRGALGTGTGGSVHPAPASRTVHGPALRRAHDEIAHENASASMSALDPRWALAARTCVLLQGGQAAILTPECRRDLIATGRVLGLRSFDINLVIAIVQDAARSGGDPLGPDVRARLHLIPAPTREDTPRQAALRVVLAAIPLAGIFCYLLCRWVGA